MNQSQDYESAIEICPGANWVGRRVEGALLNCNPYLLTLERGDKTPLHVLIDPGSPQDFKLTATKLIQLIGDLKNLSIITLNHQDPDIILTAPTLVSRFAPNALLLMTENTWRLVAHTGIPREKVKFVEQFHGTLRFKGTNRELKLVPTPFCHFTGAFGIYDVTNRILFSGDLFGGVTLDSEMFPLYAEERNWQGIRMFHELYFPCNSALKYAIEQIERLAPPVEIIAPQHGSIIKGDMLKEFMNRMARLRVGADLLSDRMDKLTWDAWNTVANEILVQVEHILGPGNAIYRIADDEELMDMARFEGNRIIIEKLPKLFIEGMVLTLTEKEVLRVANQIKVSAILACEAHGLPAPSIDLSSETTGTSDEFYPLAPIIDE
ncbi:MAG: MBL fold metallo-hydrolase [Deltaproteobacteria bacterium]|nr:MBL fold metallo-hydrolase [Deltaproteobacteria bacterium]